jgi:DNA ligase-1
LGLRIHFYFLTSPAKKNEMAEKRKKETVKLIYKKTKITEPCAEPSTINLLLAESYDPDKINPNGWYVSEKLDGVRCFWDGKSGLWSRLQHKFFAPDWFINALPQGIPLDGELYSGRGKFQQTVSIVKKHNPQDDEWKLIQLCIFDILSPEALLLKFEDRMKMMNELCESNVCFVLKQEICQGKKDIEDRLNKIIEIKGEGLMLRKPKSLYENKRSKTLLKIKRAYDAEGIVVGYEQGKGRNKDRIGALCIQLPNGKKCKLGSGLSDENRENPPKIGSTVTYQYNELTDGGIPRFPRFLRIRELL